MASPTSKEAYERGTRPRGGPFVSVPAHGGFAKWPSGTIPGTDEKLFQLGRPEQPQLSRKIREKSLRNVRGSRQRIADLFGQVFDGCGRGERRQKCRSDTRQTRHNQASPMRRFSTPRDRSTRTARKGRSVVSSRPEGNLASFRKGPFPVFLCVKCRPGNRRVRRTGGVASLSSGAS